MRGTIKMEHDDKLEKVTDKAREKAQQERNTKDANELYEKIFGNKYDYLSKSTLFVPSYFQCTLKEAFYGNGGHPLRAYSISDYARLCDTDEKIIKAILEDVPEFFIWLHEKRTMNEETDMLITMACRKIVNSMNGASLRDQAQGLNALSKFSTKVKPKEKDDSINELIDGLYTLEEIDDLLESEGYTKDSNINEDYE